MCSSDLLERSVAARDADLAKGLSGVRMDQERRALRLLPRDLAWRWLDDDSGAEGRALEVSFGLPAGAYATTVLRELAR